MTIPSWFSIAMPVGEPECSAGRPGRKRAMMFLPTGFLFLAMALLLPIVSSVTWYVSKEAPLGPEKVRDFFPKEALGSKGIPTNAPRNSGALQNITSPHCPPLLSVASPNFNSVMRSERGMWFLKKLFWLLENSSLTLPQLILEGTQVGIVTLCRGDDFKLRLSIVK